MFVACTNSTNKSAIKGPILGQVRVQVGQRYEKVSYEPDVFQKDTCRK